MAGTGTTAAAVMPTPVIENSSNPAVVERVSWMKSWKKSWKKNQNACCEDYFNEYDAGTILPDGSVKLPQSCMVQGAECSYYGVKSPARDPQLDDIMVCMDSSGQARTSAAADAAISNTPTANLPLCPNDGSETSFASRVWFALVWFIRLCTVSHCVGLLYSATLPLKYGEEGHRMYETMPYHRRLMAVTSLFMFGAGGSAVFLVAEIYLVRWSYVAQGTGETIVYAAMFCLFTVITMMPLPNRFPKKELLNSAILAMLIEYFDFEVVNECGKTVNEDVDEKYLLAQMPHAVMPYGALLGSSVLTRELPGLWPFSGVVATALMWTPFLRHCINFLGVREAGTASILQMFADGYKAVGVVTGGIAEMFVSLEREALACIRRGFGHIAIGGGHSIIIIFVIGVSRTHTIVRGFDNRYIRNMSRKLRFPLMLFSGAFLVIPHRQKLIMVIGSPIAVEKLTEGATDEDAQAVCDKVQDAAVGIYHRHKPFWEKRPIVFER
eukprot:jgi/Undpi1/12919/HiC_scaffold_7.g02585.m1